MRRRVFGRTRTNGSAQRSGDFFHGGSVERNAGHRDGHVHYRSLRRDDVGRPGRGCDQGRKRGRRSLPQLPGRPVFAPFSGLQPQQAQHCSEPEGGCGPGALRTAHSRSRCVHPELPSRHGRQARRRHAAPVRVEPATRVLLDQRFRLERPLRRSPQLRLRGAGAERLPERRRRFRATPLSGSGAGGCDHRLVCRVWLPRSPRSARPHGTGLKGRDIDAGSDGALCRRALRGILCAGRESHLR